MQLSKGKTFVFVVALVMLMVPLVSVSNAETQTLTAKEKTQLFLSSVIGIDMTKYVAIRDSSGVSYPSTFGGLVKQETEGFDFKAADGSELQGMAMYDNQFVAAFVLSITGSATYSNLYSTNALSAAKNILAKYGAFAQTCNINSPCLNSATAMLSDVGALATSNTTSGNTKMEITSSASTSDNTTSTQIAWVYTANNVDAQPKQLSISFTSFDGGVQVNFVDTWGLYSVADNDLSQAEATSIAWQAAQNYRFAMGNENGVTTYVQPVWANVTPSVGIAMVPGQEFNDSLVKTLNWTAGSTVRDPLTLYPLWQTVFYLNQSVGDAVGVQVGVWGDTTEVAYCSEFSYFGLSGPSTTAEPTISNSPQLSIQPQTKLQSPH
jgi:hypothetical protein